MAKIKPEYPRPGVSMSARLRLLEEGKKQIVIVGKFPIDPPSDKEIKMIVKSELLTARAENREPMHVENPRKNKTGMKRYKIYDKFSDEVLGYFYNKKPELDKKYCDLHYICWHDAKNWYGCKGVNVNPKTGKINFESNSGFATKEDFVKDQSGKMKKVKRYTEYYIVQDKYPNDSTK